MELAWSEVVSNPHFDASFVNAATIPHIVGDEPTTQVDVLRRTTSDLEPPAPSRQEILQRAADQSSARMTWESVVVQPDPVLGEKMQPHVAERRARFRKLVKAALGSCVACCLLAVIVSAVSEPSGAGHAAATGAIKTAPAVAVVPVERLEHPARSKAVTTRAMTAAPAFTPVRMPKTAKRR